MTTNYTYGVNMKVAEVKNNVKSDGLEEAVQWTVSESSFIFDLLSSKLYKNPHLAITRELVQNAWDAHIEANTNQPIEINLPSNSVPYLVVKDYGQGISPDLAKDLYTRLGDSSKRTSNKTQGGLGIGRCVAWCLSDSFTVDTVYNGRRYIYLAYKGVNNIPQLSSDNYEGEPTTDPSGTKITVPIKKNDVYNVMEEGKKLFRFFKVQPKCNIPLPTYTPLFSTNSYTVDKSSNSWTQQSFAVMGSIVYPIDRSMVKCDHEGYNVYFHFKIGQLSIETSRDGLVYDENTKKRINEAYTEFRKDIKERLLKETEGLKDWALHCKLNELNAKFKGLIECLSGIKITKELVSIEYAKPHNTSLNIKILDENIYPKSTHVVFIKDKLNRFLKPLREWLQSNNKTTAWVIENDATKIAEFKKLTGLTDADLLFTSQFKNPVGTRTYSGIRGITELHYSSYKSRCFKAISSSPTIKYYVIRTTHNILFRGKEYFPSSFINQLGLERNDNVTYKGVQVYAILQQHIKKLPKDAIDVSEEVVRLYESKMTPDNLIKMERFSNIEHSSYSELNNWDIPIFKNTYREVDKNRQEARELRDIKNKLGVIGISVPGVAIPNGELPHETILKKCRLIKYVNRPSNNVDKVWIESLIQRELDNKL